MKNHIIQIWQIFTYFFIGIPLRMWFRVKIQKEFKIATKATYIFASNHPSRVDPFLVTYSLPLKDFLRLVPFRFITADEYLQILLVSQVLILYGCITTRTIKNKTVLELSKELLQKGETLFIFPSGKLERSGISELPKVGVAYLEREVHNSYIIPIKIEFDNSKRFPQVNIYYKKEFRHKKFPKNLQILAQDTMDKING